MGYRVKTQRGLQRVVPEEGLGAVRRAIRERNDGVALAMSFDPGTVSDLALYAHASAIMMGLLYARGWRRAQPLTAGGVPRQNGDKLHTPQPVVWEHILARSSRSPQGPTRREPTPQPVVWEHILARSSRSPQGPTRRELGRICAAWLSESPQ